MKLAYIPPGEFLMGTADEDAEKIERIDSSFKQEWLVDERPQRRVRITRPFYLGAHEVTVAQFLTFCRDTGYSSSVQSNASQPGAGNHSSLPVTNVSWIDADAFCQWLTRKEGKIYRLPTEAEWEYACRAGSQSLFSNGDDPQGLAKIANVADATAMAYYPHWKGISARDGHVHAAPVGQFAPNAFGLHDMHGNVWEWCADWYARDYYSQAPAAEPNGPAHGQSRVLRGGCWSNTPALCRSSFRTSEEPTRKNPTVGFRVLLDVRPDAVR